MKDIQGYEGLYAVTEDGKIWAYPRQRSSKHGKWLKSRVAKTRDGRPNPRPFETISLYGADGKRTALQVHRLVAVAYVPNPGCNPVVNHIDGNSLNNHYSNLEWVTVKENTGHSFAMGLQKKRFLKNEVIEIRKICDFYPCRKVAMAYGVHHGTIWDIYKRNTYQEVDK